jgi:hypothetical protein
VIDFTAGPAGLPLEVMEQAQRELLNWRGTGMGVMEMSHRSKEVSSHHYCGLMFYANDLLMIVRCCDEQFISIADNTKALIRELL